MDSAAPTLSALDDGTSTVGLLVDDNDEGTDTDSATITVLNVAPTVASFTAEVDEGTLFTANVGFTDPGTLDMHTATIDYGDGSPSVDVGFVTDGVVPLSHSYVNDGSYSIIGGGLIDSPAGAHVPVPDPSVTGPPQFAFISKYRREPASRRGPRRSGSTPRTSCSPPRASSGWWCPAQRRRTRAAGT